MRSISDKLATLKIEINKNILVLIPVYTLTTEFSKKEIDDFYKTLSVTHQEIKQKINK